MPRAACGSRRASTQRGLQAHLGAATFEAGLVCLAPALQEGGAATNINPNR